ncbi:MAG: hypothetical protein ACKVT2_06850 [Saprospiraceae bacterium]
MKIFDSNHTGKSIATRSEQNQLRKESQFQGFFTKEFLNDLLNQPGCVGLRFYNSGQLSAGERQLIVVGVTEDGSELRLRRGKGFFLSAAAAALRQTKAQAVISVNQALRGRTPEDINRLRFTSYFSQAMIAQLLDSQEGVKGIRFYVISLNLVGQPRQTHLAVAANGPLETNVPDVAAHIASDQPCPGVGCATVPAPATPSDRVSRLAAAPESGQVLDTSKYLLIWQNG